MDLSTLAKLVLVVAAVLGLTASRCDNLENSAAVCNMLYQQMEAALLKEPENLYKLRQTFFPNSQAEPTVVGVVFSLHLNNVSSELCSDDGMNSSLDSLHLPQKFFWSSSVVIAALNPRILELFTPELLYLIDKQTSTYYDYNVDDLILILDIDSLSCSPSSDEILNGLMDLTTQLKAYANNQGQLDSWNSVNKGYSSEQRASKVAIVFFYVPTLILLVVGVLLVFKVIHTRKFIRFWKKVVDKKKPYYGIFLTSFVMITVINNMFFTMEIIGVGLWGRTNETVAVGITVSKLIHIFVSCLLPGIVAVFVAQSIAKEVPNNNANNAEEVYNFPPTESDADAEIKLVRTDKKERANEEANGAGGSTSDREEKLILKKVPDGFKCVAYFFMCGIGGILTCGIGVILICIKQKHLLHETFIIVAINFMVFVTILSWCIFPTVVLAFADPVRTSAVVSMAVFSFMCIAIAMSIVVQKRPKLVILSLIALSITAVVLSLIVLYLYIIFKGVRTGGLKGAIIAFIPAAITAATAWIGKRAIEKYGESNISIQKESKSDMKTSNTSKPKGQKVT